MKCIQVDYKDDSYAPVFRYVEGLRFETHWMHFSFAEEADPNERWECSIPAVRINQVREWVEE